MIASNVPVTLVNAADQKIGMAVYDWTVTLPNNSISESYTIGVIVNGFYTRNASTDNTVVTVSLPQSDSLTGGGYLVNQSTAGTYAGDAGEKTNFGFNVKFNKTLTKLQGKANIIIRDDGHVYQVKTNATNSLAVNQVSTGVYDATFTSKANLTDITDPLNPISLGGNLDLIVTLRDAGEPGTSDQIGITLWRGSELLFSSNWTGTQTVKQLLNGGNLQVRKSSPLLASGGAQAEDGSLPALTQTELAPIVDEARARWTASGLTADQTAALGAFDLKIADLDAATLGLTEGRTIWLDQTAAGYGWFIDPTPQDNAEFHFVRGLAEWVADAQSSAAGHMDLLTTVMHEFGHVLGFDDQQVLGNRTDLMGETLLPGVRRVVSADPFVGTRMFSGESPEDGSTAETVSVTELPSFSLKQFAGALGDRGNGGERQPSDAVSGASLIDWTDSAVTDRRSSSSPWASMRKPAWLHRFLVEDGVEEALENLGIEVMLPGKK